MKLLSFEAGGAASFGAAINGGVVDLGARLSDVESLHDLLKADGLDRARKALDGASPDHGLDDIRFLRPILYPEKTFCIGVNYANRNKDYEDTAIPAYPSIFVRAPDTLVGHKEPIVRPPESDKFDYEGEIAIVVGTGGRRIPEERAHDHIAGLTCLNDGTIRDWLRHGKFNVTPGKNFENSGAIGPWLATADEIGNFDDVRVTTRVNGEVRQDDTTANLYFSFRYIINYVSTFVSLKPGDVISTGTPVGAGVGMDPPIFLVPGDVVEIEVGGVGTLSNTVVDEA